MISLMVGMDTSYVVTVVFAGIFVVFLGLLIIIGIVYLMSAITKLVGKISTKLGPKIAVINEKKAAKKAAKLAAKQAEKETVAPEKSASVATNTAPVVEQGISEEIVAVISAAVASMSSDGKGFTIRGIKKAKKTGRSAWANAGLQDNTRAF